ADNDPINRAGAMPTVLTASARDALTWATINGAEACGFGAEVGSLRPGKQADVVVLGREDSFALRPRVDPVSSVVFQATAHDVRDVLVAGKAVKRNGALVGVDVRGVLERAERSAERVLDRVRQLTPVLPPQIPGLDLEAIARANLAEVAG